MNAKLNHSLPQHIRNMKSVLIFIAGLQTLICLCIAALFYLWKHLQRRKTLEKVRTPGTWSRCLRSIVLRCWGGALFSRGGVRLGAAAALTQLLQLHKTFSHRFSKFARRRLFTVFKAGNAEQDMLWLWIVAGTVPIWDHSPIAAEHFHGGWNLVSRTKKWENINRTKPSC